MSQSTKHRSAVYDRLVAEARNLYETVVQIDGRIAARQDKLAADIKALEMEARADILLLQTERADAHETHKVVDDTLNRLKDNEG